ncbi:hypothetical protein BLA60_13300 [Actinophytocola xinjiangensis]|uniref:Mce-associated membrane protein n=1 Tax=Actinophytocola xinjiangensis TaxID=485602 RepID=A0A7Z0WMI3_9PSEU|nr:hypothetical protein BLA60_13300 [Actinophytocola xinjiangensis]
MAGLRHRPGPDTPAPEDTTADTTAEDTAQEAKAAQSPAAEPEPPAKDDDRPGVDLGTTDPEPEAPEPEAPEPEKAKAEKAKAEEAKADEAAPPEPESAKAAESETAEAEEAAEAEPTALVARSARHRAQRPAGKRRAAGVTRPADLSSAESDSRAAADSAPQPRPNPHRAARRRGVRHPYPVAAVLAVVAVLLGAGAFWFRGEASALESRDTNTALTDSSTTSEVLGQLTTAVETTLSYNYTDLESTKKAVDASLTESARCEYDMLFKQLMQLAPEQKLILATTVRDIGLVRLDGDRAEALVFIDLVSTRVDTNKTVPGEAVFGVRARRDGDSWKIIEFNMFDQELVTGEPVPQC